MKKVFLSVFGIFIISIAIYSCSKESTTSNTSDKSIQKSTVATVKPPRSLEEYMQLEDYVRQNVDISHDQFVQYGKSLAFSNNIVIGSDNTSESNYLTPLQFVMLHKVIFKSFIQIDYQGNNDYYAKVNKISKDLGGDDITIAPNVTWYEKQNPWDYCHDAVEKRCCCLIPIYKKYYND